MRKELLIFLVILVFGASMLAQGWQRVAGFDLGSPEIPAESKIQLRRIVKDLNPNDHVICIKGVTDEVKWQGSHSYSEVLDTLLAEKRAVAVARFYSDLGFKTKVVGINNYIPGDDFRGAEVRFKKVTKPVVAKSVIKKKYQIYRDKYFRLGAGIKSWISLNREAESIVSPVIELGLYQGDQILVLGGGFTPWDYKNDSFLKVRNSFCYGELRWFVEDYFFLAGGLSGNWQWKVLDHDWMQMGISPELGFGFRWRWLNLAVSYSPSWVETMFVKRWMQGVSVKLSFVGRR